MQVSPFTLRFEQTVADMRDALDPDTAPLVAARLLAPVPRTVQTASTSGRSLFMG